MRDMSGFIIIFENKYRYPLGLEILCKWKFPKGMEICVETHLGLMNWNIINILPPPQKKSKKSKKNQKKNKNQLI
jgi:hypothetical protein